jgi:mRNA (2'-O-methyladenosine-N6-)-methyltransferase
MMNKSQFNASDFSNHQEQLIVEKFKSQGGANVQEFCEHGTREECKRNRAISDVCKKVTLLSTCVF